MIAPKRATLVAWSLCVFGLAALLAGAVLQSDNGGNQESLVEQIGLVLGFGAFPVIGSLVVARYPRNALGWLFVGVGVGIGFLLLAEEYARWALAPPGDPRPGATLAAWLTSWLWYPVLAIVATYGFLLFPTGLPPSPRWRWLVWVTGALVTIVTVGAMVQDRLRLGGHVVDNPIGIPGFNDVEASFGPLFGVFAACALLCAFSLVIRFRHSRGEERQQLKFIAFGAVFFVFGSLGGDLYELPEWLFAVLLLAVPASIGVAMLRYRLYDIDRVISNTIVYGSVTALLTAGYFALVLLIQRVLPVPQNSPVVVAMSTLAVVALFRPVAERVRAFVARRFYRRKYDAAITVEGFSSRLRSETDLDSLAADLVRVVQDTMQPQHVSLWLSAERTEH